MRALLILSIMLTFLANVCMAAEPAEIELRDGSILHAEIVSVQNDFYTLKSGDLGTITLERSKIRAIRMGGSGGQASNSANAASSSTLDTGSQVKALGQVMLSDQSILDKLPELSKDPAVMKIMQDPEIMKAVNAGDVASLMGNENFLKLLDNASVQSIVRKVSP